MIRRRPNDVEVLAALDCVGLPANPRVLIAHLKDQEFFEHEIRAQLWSMLDRKLLVMNAQWRVEKPLS